MTERGLLYLPREAVPETHRAIQMAEKPIQTAADETSPVGYAALCAPFAWKATPRSEATDMKHVSRKKTVAMLRRGRNLQ